MGMNKRNFAYIARYNDRRLYPNVDDKVRTKELALEAGLAVPELLGRIKFQHDVELVFDQIPIGQGFCIKPSRGSGGKGIMVILGEDENGLLKASGSYVQREDVIRHTSNVLAGLFSLGGDADIAMIEALIEFDPVFNGYSHEGVPDIRIIVFKGYPVMAMMRLATHASDGKANLHQGAVGVGLNMATGAAIAAVQHNHPISQHPDTDKPLDAIQVANWQSLLSLASKCYEVSGLGYLGVDLVLDKSRGPLVLELNARPGLAIQIANQHGILPRLQEIEAMQHKSVPNVEARVAYAMQHFGSD